MKIKKIIIFFVFLSFITSGYIFEPKFKAGIIFSREPFNKATIDNYRVDFYPHERIYWLLMSKKPLKAKFIKLQILNSNSKSGFTTFEGVAYTHIYRLNSDSPYYFTDYFVMQTKGHYYVQIFDLNDLQRPITRADFWIKNKN